MNGLRYLRQSRRFNIEQCTLDSLHELIGQSFGLPCPTPRTFGHFVLLKKISITPSRFIFGEPVAVAKNRVLRKFHKEDVFVLVDFTDEEGQRLCGGDGSLLSRIEEILVSINISHLLFSRSVDHHKLTIWQLYGLILMGIRYHFIFGNARKGSCWFSRYTVDELELGDLSGLLLFDSLYFSSLCFMLFGSC